MFKNKIKKMVIINMFIVICAIGTMVNAESGKSFKAEVTPTSNTIKPGEEITISLKISDINMGDNGINALEGTIKYDKEIFEEITSSNIQSFNNWTTTYNDESSTLNGKFLSVNLSSGVKENTQIFSLKFKAKQSISKTTNTQIEFQDITSNDGIDLINVGTKTVNVTITVEKQNETQGNTINKTNVIENKTNTKVVDNTQSAKILPKTGLSTTISIIVVISIMVAIGLGIKNKNMKDIK